MPTDPGTTLTTLAAIVSTALDAKDLGSMGKQLLDWKTNRFKAVVDEMMHRWIAELAAAFAGQASDLRSVQRDAERLRADLEEQARDHQLLRVFVLGFDDGEREPLDERREMMACAVAALVVPGMTSETKARAMRTIRELDPKDVMWLDRIARTVSSGEDTTMPDALARSEAWRTSPSRDALVAAGCVLVNLQLWHGDGPLTERAGHVLRLVDRYVVPRRQAFDAMNPPLAKTRVGSVPVFTTSE